MSQFCIIAQFETADVTCDEVLVIVGFDTEAQARMHATRDGRLRTAADIQIAPSVQADAVQQEPLFTIYFEGRLEQFHDVEEWYDMQSEHDDEADCLRILDQLDRTGATTWASVDYRRRVPADDFTIAFRNLLAKAAPTLNEDLDRQKWLDTLDALNKKTEKLATGLGLTVAAEAHSDDYQEELVFDATVFLTQASDDELVALVNCDFGGDYPADAAVYFYEGILPDVDSMLAWGRGDGNCGFECHLDQQQAERWLARFRPHVLEQAAAAS